MFAGDTKILVSFWHGPAVLRQGFLILFDQYVTSSAVGLQSNELAFITLLISDITSSLFISIHSYIWHVVLFSAIFGLHFIQPSSSFLLCKYNSREKKPFVPLCQEDMLNINMDMFLKTKLFSGSLLADFIIHLFSVECSYLKPQSSLQRLCTVAVVYVGISDEAQYCLFSIISQHCL